MYNERNILTMTDEEVKDGIIYFADKYGVRLKHIFLCREDDGYLDIFIEPTEEIIYRRYERSLHRYMAGITDINEIVVGSNNIDCPSVAVYNISNGAKYKRVYDRCVKSGGELFI